jgi:hypothetical protein
LATLSWPLSASSLPGRLRRRLAAGEEVARMYQEPGLAWLERQAEVTEEAGAHRKRTTENRPGS